VLEIRLRKQDGTWVVRNPQKLRLNVWAPWREAAPRTHRITDLADEKIVIEGIAWETLESDHEMHNKLMDVIPPVLLGHGWEQRIEIQTARLTPEKKVRFAREPRLALSQQALTEVTLGKFFGKLRDFFKTGHSPEEVNALSKEARGRLDMDKYPFQVIEGLDIVKVYRRGMANKGELAKGATWYDDVQVGTAPGSCTCRTKGIELYQYTPERIKMIIHEEKGRIKTRALVWRFDDFTYVDYPYGIGYGQDKQASFNNFVKDKGWVRDWPYGKSEPIILNNPGLEFWATTDTVNRIHAVDEDTISVSVDRPKGNTMVFGQDCGQLLTLGYHNDKCQVDIGKYRKEAK